jgi:hypothetical protein
MGDPRKKYCLTLELLGNFGGLARMAWKALD